MMRIAVMASGGGSNFQAILDRTESGELVAEVVLLISNNSNCGAVNKAKSAKIETLHLAPSSFEDEAEYTKQLTGHLERVKCDIIVLAGYMKRVPSGVIQKFRNRILNIHPALLPSFGGKGMYGARVHEAVLKYGAKISGITVHLVDEDYDHGPIVMQRCVEVMDGDTPDVLATRVLKLEHDTYWRAIKFFAEGRVKVHGRKTMIS